MLYTEVYTDLWSWTSIFMAMKPTQLRWIVHLSWFWEKTMQKQQFW